MGRTPLLLILFMTLLAGSGLHASDDPDARPLDTPEMNAIKRECFQSKRWETEECRINEELGQDESYRPTGKFHDAVQSGVQETSDALVEVKKGAKALVRSPLSPRAAYDDYGDRTKSLITAGMKSVLRRYPRVARRDCLKVCLAVCVASKLIDYQDDPKNKYGNRYATDTLFRDKKGNCTDIALVAKTLSKELGLEDVKMFSGGKSSSDSSHQFVGLKIGEGWYGIEPQIDSCEFWRIK